MCTTVEKEKILHYYQPREITKYSTLPLNRTNIFFIIKQ